MLNDAVTKFVENYSLQNLNNKIQTNQSNHKITQSEIMNRIHIEFQKPFIKKLYTNHNWTKRVFWNVAGYIYNYYEDMEMDVSLNLITQTINQYLVDNKSQKPNLSQRDVIELIRTIILNNQVDRISELIKVQTNVVKAGVTEDKFKEYLNQMKREGSVFEPKKGYLKVV